MVLGNRMLEVLWDVDEKAPEVLWIEEKKVLGVLCYFSRSAKAVELPFQDPLMAQF